MIDCEYEDYAVALRVRAWIEIATWRTVPRLQSVALRVRAWIEIRLKTPKYKSLTVALRVRAWIEIKNCLIEK